MKQILITALSTAVLVSLSSCGKKKFEDTDTYREMIKHQEEVDRRVDSMKKENYKQLTDSMNSSFKKEMDSLKHITDSLMHQLDKNIQNLKNRKAK